MADALFLPYLFWCATLGAISMLVLVLGIKTFLWGKLTT